MEKKQKTILIVAAIIVIAAIASTITVSKKLKNQLSDKKDKDEDAKQDDNKSEPKTNEPKTKESNEQQENNNPKKNVNYKDLPDKNPPFKLGDKAKLIYAVQVMLNKKYNAGLETDGIMGEKTIEALCKHVWKTCFSKYQARNYELTLEEIQKILK
jgi:FtsZ-interacting cell division protein ZipA